jgi:hypothetical protein
MDTENVEIECPVCDQMVRADAPRCPHCGAEFAMAGIDELERVAREINDQPTPEGSAVKQVPAESPAAVVVDDRDVDDLGGKGFFGKLFRKRR